MDRKDKALNILQAFQNGNYRYLGEGQEGVVFTDNCRVYKVFDSFSEYKLSLLRLCIPSLDNAVHLYEIEDIVDFKNLYILIYKYEESEPISTLNENDFVDFLVEMWQRKLVFSNMNPKNFIRVNGIIKLIDPEFSSYTDNLFLNMCVRAFIHLKYFGQEKYFIKKLGRSAIDNFNLPELTGVQEFVNRVFSAIIYKESQPAIQDFNYQTNKVIRLNYRLINYRI